MAEYYIQNKERGYLGNSPMWWSKNGRGYTPYIICAERFSEKEALELVEEDPKKWKMFKCHEVDRRLHLIFDSQDNPRLNTDPREESSFPWGEGSYAEYPEQVKKYKDALQRILALHHSAAVEQVAEEALKG